MRNLLTILLFSFLTHLSFGQEMFYSLNQPPAATASYLLDSFPATAAYSLRKLSSSAIYAVRVIRSFDNVFQNIGFTANGDLDTVALKTFIGPYNARVVVWFDQSGHNDSLKCSLNNGPLLDSVGIVLRENGKPCVSFAGTAANQLNTSPSIISGTTSRSIISVQREYSGGSATGLYSLNTTYTSTGGALWVVYMNSTFTIQTPASSSYTYPSGLSNLSYSLLSTFFSGGNQSNITNYFNGNLMPVSSLGTLATINTNNYQTTVGAGANNTQHLNASMQEIIFYSSDQSSNRSAIESNINSYYSIY